MRKHRGYSLASRHFVEIVTKITRTLEPMGGGGFGLWLGFRGKCQEQSLCAAKELAGLICGS